MRSTLKTRKARRVRDAKPSVIVMIFGTTAHNPNTSQPTAPRKGRLAGCVSGQFWRGCFMAIWLLLGSAALPGGGTESQACNSFINSNSA